MTQRLHLVFGGELVDPQTKQRTVDNAHMRYYIAHIHRLRDEEKPASSTEELGR